MLFDKAVCLTLDRRLHAGESDIVEQLARHGAHVERFLVGDGQLYPRSAYSHLDLPAKPRQQAYNYALALHKVIRASREEGVRRLFYLEDDAQLTPHFERLFPTLHTQLALLPAVWDILFLGGNHVNGPVAQLTENILLAHYSLDMHAVIFNRSSFDTILGLEASPHRTIDGAIADLQCRGELTVFAVHPAIVTQKPGWSYNENRFVDRSVNHCF